MNNESHPDEHDNQERASGPRNLFAEQGSLDRTSLAGEFVEFLKHNKKWWLLPILVVLVLVGALLVVGGSAAAPFVYTMF